ncbi:MAG TPA: folate-binding protein [Rudaea sp.]|nr:folate-binding protein [Rudaea sp.]
MIALPPPELLDIAGGDARAFAHAQFSSDVASLAVGQWQWSAWLTPQGRVRYFFALMRESEDRLRLVLRGGDATTLRAALAPYVLRAKVELRAVSGVAAYGVNADEAHGALGGIPAPGAILYHGDLCGFSVPGTPVRICLLGPAGLGGAAALERWRLADIRAGLPEVPPALAERALPQWLGLERLGAVSVRKGCYPGQEVMARLHFKGGNKRVLQHVEFRHETALETGATVPGSGDNGPLAVMSARNEDGRQEALLIAGDDAAGEFKVVSRFS